MRLFFYYAVHSFLNTLKKLLKTWVAVFLVIGLGGALIGGIIGLVASAVVKDDEPEQKFVFRQTANDNARPVPKRR